MSVLAIYGIIKLIARHASGHNAVRKLIGANMTENQRDYLADLAGQKGTRLFNTDDWSVAKASSEIERLKEMPDANFDEITSAEAGKIDALTANALSELRRWGFARRES